MEIYSYWRWTKRKLIFDHKNLKVLGFQNHTKVLNIFKKTSIAVACSRWEEPFGRTSLEASSRGCAVIVSNRGGLPEQLQTVLSLEIWMLKIYTIP